MTKHPPYRIRGRRQRGAALVGALVFALLSAMMISASICVSSSHYDLAFSQSRSEAVLLLAEGGINDELSYVAKNFEGGVATLSSAPTIGNGETMVFPGENHAVYGRKGTIAGADGYFWVCTTNNEWWKSGATPVAWDKRTTPVWITATAYANGVWRRVECQATANSVFGLYAVFGVATYSTPTTDIGLSTATVSITGLAGTNGQVTNTSSTLTASGVINANTVDNATGQFGASNVATGGTTYTSSTPFLYPTTVSVLKQLFNIGTYSDSAAWTYLSTHNSNNTGVYTYKSGAASSTIAAANCTQFTTSIGTSLENGTGGDWTSAAVKPGTSSKVKTLIFEPGDYYFTSIGVTYDGPTEIVIDPQAFASGGTPGQVRFWVYDPGTTPKNDNLSIPVTWTTASGAFVPDSSLFRIYYGKDGKSFTFGRPSGLKDVNNNNLVGDFRVYGGVYAVTRPPGVPGSTLLGATVNFTGTTGTTGGKVLLSGSLLADKIAFAGPSAIAFSRSSNPDDLPTGLGVSGGYSDGG